MVIGGYTPIVKLVKPQLVEANRAVGEAGWEEGGLCVCVFWRDLLN